MNVEGAVLDTNACLYLLKGQVKPEFQVEDGLISVVTEVELLGYPSITVADEKLINDFLSRFGRISVDDAVITAAIQLRKMYRLRLGDALICGTALARNAPLVSHDKELSKVAEIELIQMPLQP